MNNSESHKTHQKSVFKYAKNNIKNSKLPFFAFFIHSFNLLFKWNFVHSENDFEIFPIDFVKKMSTSFQRFLQNSLNKVIAKWLDLRFDSFNAW